MLIKPMSVDKRSFLGFCGSGGGSQREQLIRDIKASQKEDFIFDEFVIGDKMVESINSYDLHFNFNVMDDINYRSFETLGCKIPLITNYNYQYDKLGFKDNINCIFYRNRDELIEKINYYKDNKLLLESISEKGYNLSTNHTYRNRIKHLKDKIL